MARYAVGWWWRSAKRRGALLARIRVVLDPSQQGHDCAEAEKENARDDDTDAAGQARREENILKRPPRAVELNNTQDRNNGKTCSMNSPSKGQRR